MGIRLWSFVMTKCPRCRFRHGHRAANRGSRLLGFVGIHALECRSCNLRFWAFLSARAKAKRADDQPLRRQSAGPVPRRA